MLKNVETCIFLHRLSKRDILPVNGVLQTEEKQPRERDCFSKKGILGEVTLLQISAKNLVED